MRNIFFFAITTFFSYIVICAYSAGTATPPNGQNRTGAGGSAPNCNGSGCHAANNSNLSISIIPVEIANNDTAKGNYKPNTAYKVKIWAVNSAGGTYPKFSFQFAAEDVNNIGAGNYFPTPGLQANPIGNIEVVEPYQPKNTMVNKCIDSVNWISPQKNAGAVTFHATVLAANNDGFATGDLVNNISRTLVEGPSSTDDILRNNFVSIYPNPAQESLTLSINNWGNEDYQLIVFNQFGQEIHEETLLPTSGKITHKIDVDNYAPGTYSLLIANGTEQKLLKFIKL